MGLRIVRDRFDFECNQQAVDSRGVPESDGEARVSFGSGWVERGAAVPIRMTADPHMAATDCLFYAVRPAEESSR